MKKQIVPMLGLLIVLSLAACAQGNMTPVQQTAEAIESSTQSVNTAITSPTATVTAVPVNTRTRYTISAVLDYPNRSLSVTEEMLYTNRSTEAMNELVFVVEPNLTDGAFELITLTWQDGTAVEGYILNSQRLTVPLREPLQPGANIRVNFSFNLYPPGMEGVFCFTVTQVNLSGWYPYAAPYIEGKGWVVHDPGKVGEYQVYELADFTVDLRVDNAPDDFMVAASARATIDDSGVFHFEQEDVRNFTWSGSSNYKMFEAFAGDIRVRAFVFPTDQVAGQAALDATVQALNLYSSLFGPYTHNSLTIVEAGFADGMEYDGLHYLGREYFNAYEGLPSSYLTAISVHETAHQWWYGMVGNDQAYEPWLDESLAAYSELLYYENTYPDLVKWWWETRVNYFNPKGWVNNTIYDYSYFRPYVNAIYLRGVQCLEAIRQEIGDEAFMAFLKDYFTTIHERGDEDHLGLASSTDFWEILSRHTDANLSAIKETYFSQP
jgi:hypothetical protein